VPRVEGRCLVLKLFLRTWGERGVRVILMSATLQGGIFENYFGEELAEPVPRLHVGVKRHPGRRSLVAFGLARRVFSDVSHHVVSVREVYLEHLPAAFPEIFGGRRLSSSVALAKLRDKFAAATDVRQRRRNPQFGNDIVRPMLFPEMVNLAVQVIHEVRGGRTPKLHSGCGDGVTGSRR
jgi:hypothetical protein